MFAWGMWFGIVYRRWNLIGMFTFIAAQAAALIAALAVALLAGGYATICRVRALHLSRLS
ncbi:MAG: hypothetical protein ACRDOK_31130 [Streptosporangiaceae bacterium]